jgi:hypothetical protein
MTGEPCQFVVALGIPTYCGTQVVLRDTGQWMVDGAKYVSIRSKEVQLSGP